MAWKVAGEFVRLKNITLGSKSPRLVTNATFHLSPSLIRTLLYPHRMLRPSCYLGAMRPLMPTFTSLLPYLYDWAAHSRLPDSLRT